MARPGETPMTLAIGDGANDVGMIQEAQIGVGISGHEGMQAVNNSDFAIAQFRFLKRLLLVHGRWNYRRTAKVFLYSFYKNTVLTLTLFAYLPLSKFSGQSLYESLVYAGYNFFLGWPIIGVGLFDRDISAKTMLKYPELYMSGRLNLDLRVRVMLEWVIMAVVHALFIYFIPLFTFSKHYDLHYQNNIISNLTEYDHIWTEYSIFHNGKSAGIYFLGTATYACLIFAMQWKVLWHTYSWTWVTALFMVGFSLPLFFGFMFIYADWPALSTNFYGVALQVYGNLEIWLCVLLVTMSIGIVEYVKEWCRMQRCPTAIDIAMELDRGFLLNSGESQDSEAGEAGEAGDTEVMNPVAGVRASIESRSARLERMVARHNTAVGG